MLMPLFAAIDVTYKCNLCCKHCYNSSGGNKNSRTDELTDEQLLYIIESVAKTHPESVCFCGGEPLLRKNVLFEGAKLIKAVDPKINVNVVTNSLLLENDDYLIY